MTLDGIKNGGGGGKEYLQQFQDMEMRITIYYCDTRGRKICSGFFLPSYFPNPIS